MRHQQPNFRTSSAAALHDEIRLQTAQPGGQGSNLGLNPESSKLMCQVFMNLPGADALGPFKLDGIQGSLSLGVASELFYSLK